MGKRFICLILDGFGVGAMNDVATVRPNDGLSSTLGSILNDYKDLKLPHLERLGLMNAYGTESDQMSFSPSAVFGKSELKHCGADTFMGHQEIMGTLPKPPLSVPFQDKVDKVKVHLEMKGHEVKVLKQGTLRYLLVDHYCTVADNIDADLGMAYNCTAPLDFMSFETELEIAKQVREVVEVNRVIPFGGTKTTIDDILKAEETRQNKFIGIHAVKSKSYQSGYQCRHLGYGVDNSVQAPTILTKHHIPVSLFGKVADVVINDGGKSVSFVQTEGVLDLTIAELKTMQTGFICTNVQETDLAGHSQDSKWYKELLELTDKKVGTILGLLKEDDIFLIMADHGNDPNIGHNQHTRENVPLLIYREGVSSINIGVRKTLSDVGATVCDYFEVEMPQNGISFLSLIHK